MFYLSPAVSASPHPDATDALAALRGATREQHARVDRLMDLQRMREPGHYARVLQVLDAFLGAWEPAATAMLPARRQRWLQARSRRPFLQQDLRDLGLPAATPAPLMPVGSRAAAWGTIYVVEGSALGGRFITRWLAKAGLYADGGMAYFRGWGEATEPMWGEVRALLQSELDSPAAIAQACEAARQAFDTLSVLLEHHLHERTPAA